MNVINARGEKEPFSKTKIYRSARRAGASNRAAKEISEILEKEAYEGIRTQKIFARIRQILRKESPTAAIKFNIKEGMRKLGPTGFPFERYVAEILKSLGYRVRINLFIPGKCVRSYEIDFIALKGNVVYVGECKYRRYFGDRVHSQDALANYARFLDICSGSYFKAREYKGASIKTMLVTNTKFSGRTMDYSKCVGAELLGWNYPRNKGLERLVEERKLYPVTILPGLKGYLKDIFVREKIMLAKDLLRIDVNDFSKKHKVSLKQIQNLVGQAEQLLR